jgi:uncharacterized protein YceK
MKRVFAIGALVCALTGCGTVQNLERGPLSTAVPYGGVEIAAAQLKAKPAGGDFVRMDFPEWLCAADVVFSAVGDTLALPVIIPFQIVHDINVNYFSGEVNPPAGSGWREFWFSEAQPPPVPLSSARTLAP